MYMYIKKSHNKGARTCFSTVYSPRKEGLPRDAFEAVYVTPSCTPRDDGAKRCDRWFGTKETSRVGCSTLALPQTIRLTMFRCNGKVFVLVHSIFVIFLAC